MNWNRDEVGRANGGFGCIDPVAYSGATRLGSLAIEFRFYIDH